MIIFTPLNRPDPPHGRSRRNAAAVLPLMLTAAVCAEAPVSPLPVPEYSFDQSSPSVENGDVIPSDVLRFELPHPAAAFPGELLGLVSPTDDLDALSASNSDLSEMIRFSFLLSVDRQTKGDLPPDPYLVQIGVPFNVFDQADRGHAAGDQFYSTETFTRHAQIGPLLTYADTNTFLTRNNFDEGGTDFAAYPETHADTILNPSTPQDRVDAMAKLVIGNPDAGIGAVYFSVSIDSPSLRTLPGGESPSGAHIFVCRQPSLPAGACCIDGEGCELLSSDECSNLGGSWLGADTSCADCSSSLYDGACCLEERGCQIIRPELCLDMGGIWLGSGTSCWMCGPTRFGGVPEVGGGRAHCASGLGGGSNVSEGRPSWSSTSAKGNGDLGDSCAELYASFSDLGLKQADDIDAMIVIDTNDNGLFDGTDQVFFSLTPSSPSLSIAGSGASPASAADVLVAARGRPPVVFAPAGMFGLGAPEDNIDALDYTIVESWMSRPFEHGIRSIWDKPDRPRPAPKRPRLLRRSR